MAGTLKELYNDVQHCPLPHGLQVKDDSMREWSNNTELYTVTMRVEESGPGRPGILLSPLLPHQPTPTQSEPQPETRAASQEESVFTPFPPTHTATNSPDSLRARWTLKGRQTASSCSSEQFPLGSSLLLTSRWHSVRSRPN